MSAVILAPLASAQLVEILPDRKNAFPISLNVEREWGTDPALTQETPAASSNANPNPWTLSLITSGYIVPDAPVLCIPGLLRRPWLVTPGSTLQQ